MKFKVEKAPFVSVLQNLVSIVPTKTTLHVLTNFLITLKGDALDLCATDLDISMRTTLYVKGDGDGAVTINARKLFEIVRELPEAPFTIKVDKNILHIKSDKGFACRIAGIDTGDFPQTPTIESPMDLSIPAHVLNGLASKTSFAVSTDSTRASLNGILWEIREKEMRMVATDGHRLGYCSYRHNLSVKGLKSVIISPKSINHLLRMVQETETKEIAVSIGASLVSFTAGNSTIVSKLIEGPYPNYDQVIPKSNSKKAIIDSAELIASLRRVSILSNVKTHQIKFFIKEGLLTLSSVNRDFGADANEEIPATYSGDPMEIGFNASFFMEILKLAATPKIKISFNSPISACLVHPENEEKTEEETFFLLMPLRLLDDK